MALIKLTFRTTVSGKSLTQPIECSAKDLEYYIRTYKDYGWWLIGYRYISL